MTFSISEPARIGRFSNTRDSNSPANRQETAEIFATQSLGRTQVRKMVSQTGIASVRVDLSNASSEFGGSQALETSLSPRLDDLRVAARRIAANEAFERGETFDPVAFDKNFDRRVGSQLRRYGEVMDAITGKSLESGGVTTIAEANRVADGLETIESFPSLDSVNVLGAAYRAKEAQPGGIAINPRLEALGPKALQAVIVEELAERFFQTTFGNFSEGDFGEEVSRRMRGTLEEDDAKMLRQHASSDQIAFVAGGETVEAEAATAFVGQYSSRSNKNGKNRLSHRFDAPKANINLSPFRQNRMMRLLGFPIIEFEHVARFGNGNDRLWLKLGNQDYPKSRYINAAVEMGKGDDRVFVTNFSGPRRDQRFSTFKSGNLEYSIIHGGPGRDVWYINTHNSFWIKETGTWEFGNGKKHNGVGFINRRTNQVVIPISFVNNDNPIPYSTKNNAEQIAKMIDVFEKET